MTSCNDPKTIFFDIKEISTNPDITTTTSTSNSILSYEEDKRVISTLVEVKVKQQIYPTQEDLAQYYTKYEASNQYADVVFYTNSTSQQFLFIEVNIKNAEGVSAVHIHINNNGSSGPIIAWLATTPEWEHGILQNTPLTNYPCTGNGFPMATLISPTGTPNINEIVNKKKRFIVEKPACSECAWISTGTRLDIHGKKFQQLYCCELVGETPGLDMLVSTAFVQALNPTADIVG